MGPELIEISGVDRDDLDENITDIEHDKNDLEDDESFDTENKDDIRISPPRQPLQSDKGRVFNEANDKNSNAEVKTEFFAFPANVEEQPEGVETDSLDILDAIAEAESDDLKSDNEGTDRNKNDENRSSKNGKRLGAATNNKKKVDKVIVDIDGQYLCERCKEPFKTTAAHNKHYTSRICFIRESYDSPKDLFECSKCTCTFLRKDYLDTHSVLHDEPPPYNFRLEFVEVSDLVNHIEEMKDDDDFCCPVCDNCFNSRKLLLHHVILTHGKDYLCMTCNLKCRSKSGCKAHMKTHTEDSTEENIHQCQICKKRFRSQATLSRHDLTMHAKGEVPSYACDECKKIFSSEHFLDKHKEIVHFKAFVCSHNNCKKCFPSQKKLAAHMACHEDRSFMCNVCGRMFNSKSNFLKHMNIHDTVRKHECDVCKKTFKTKDVLTKHKRIHSGTRRFCCDICGRGFHQSGGLHKHMDSHYNIKRYECDVCLKKFTNKASLYNHRLQNNHFSPNEQTQDMDDTIKCEYCDKLFPPGNLYMYKRHVVIHTGDKPYTCDICSKTFNDKSNLKYHKLIHLENKPFSCAVCGKGFVQKRGLSKHIQSSQSCSKSFSKESDIYIDADHTSVTSNLPGYPSSGNVSEINQYIPNVIVYSSAQDPPLIRQLNIPFQETYQSIEPYTNNDDSLKSDSVVPNVNNDVSTESI